MDNNPLRFCLLLLAILLIGRCLWGVTNWHYSNRFRTLVTKYSWAATSEKEVVCVLRFCFILLTILSFFEEYRTGIIPSILKYCESAKQKRYVCAIIMDLYVWRRLQSDFINSFPRRTTWEQCPMNIDATPRCQVDVQTTLYCRFGSLWLYYPSLQCSWRSLECVDQSVGLVHHLNYVSLFAG